MGISKTTQEQKAGDNSSQYQQIGDDSNQIIIENQTNNYSVSGLAPTDIVAFTTTLSTQVSKQALSLCTQVSEDICISRMRAFESKWNPVLTKMDGILDHFIDPKFQFMLRDAYISSAKSSREQDLDMLTQLLVCHVEKGKDMKIDAGINRAIQIVNEVDNDALCGLTIVTSLLKVVPADGDIYEGLKTIDGLYTKLLYTELPKGDRWIDHLDVLGAIGIRTGKFYKLKEILSEKYNGYICVGIKDGSVEMEKTMEILIKHNYDLNCLVPNECLPGFTRISCVQKESLKPELKPIFDLYSKDSKLLEQARTTFMEKWDSYNILRKFREWFEEIPLWFRITSVGYALAQTNAKRCFPDFPDII